MSQIFDKLYEGGPFFMYPMVVVLFIVIALFIYAIIKKDKFDQIIEYLKSLGWLTAAWGLLGHTIGLIMGFDAVAAAQDIAPEILAAGLKVALLTPLLGTIVFIVARLEIIVLLLLKKKS
jgi:cytochrome c oxidase assembly factor CtaG